jgi:hypothetical protein
MIDSTILLLDDGLHGNWFLTSGLPTQKFGVPHPSRVLSGRVGILTANFWIADRPGVK